MRSVSLLFLYSTKWKKKEFSSSAGLVSELKEKEVCLFETHEFFSLFKEIEVFICRLFFISVYVRARIHSSKKQTDKKLLILFNTSLYNQLYIVYVWLLCTVFSAFFPLVCCSRSLFVQHQCFRTREKEKKHTANKKQII